MLNKTQFTFCSALCASGLVAFSVVAEADERAIQKDYPLEKLSQHVYVIHGPNEDATKANQGFRNNPVIVETNDGIVVIDPGSSLYTGEMVVKKAQTISSKPIIAVFNSHEHGDHWLGNHGIQKHFANVTIYAHENAKASIESSEGEGWIKAMNDQTKGQTEGTLRIAPNKVIKDGEVLKIGGLTFRIFHNGKAHSHGDTMIEIVEDKVLALGDNLRDKNLSPFMSGFKGNLEALEIGLQLNASIYIPGHGISGDKTIIVPYQNFLTTLLREVKKHFDAGLSDFEMKPKVVDALKPFQKWVGFEENIGRLISLAYLEIENEAF